MSKASAVCTALPEGIEDRAHLVVDQVRQRHDVERRDLHELGKRARQIDANALGVWIEMKLPCPAGARLHADDVPLTGDALAYLEVLHVTADCRDHAGILMPVIIGTGIVF